jgi:thiamine-phosphate pyrophosphorylase
MKLCGLYPIVDLYSLEKAELDPIEFCREVLKCRPALFQLRAKHAQARQVLALLRQMRPLCRQSGTLLFANDRPDLALLGGCDGVHVGQDDLSVVEVRRLAPSLLVGVSTHDQSQLERTLGQKPFYVAYGPVYETESKQNPDPVVGLSGLQWASETAEQAGVSLVAIGGISLARAPSIASVNAVGAVIRELIPANRELGRVADIAQALHRALGGSA